MTACVDNNTPNTPNGGGGIDLTPEPTPTPKPTNGDVLIVYFSCTNTVKGLAEKVQKATGGTLYRIEPKIPYTPEDLDYYSGGRADQEQADPTARPEIGSDSITNFSEYDTVFLGYPIWHGQAPKIIYTFLESYDFSGKTVIPFCTSASSPMGSSATNLHSLTNGATWLDGTRFERNASESTVTAWVESLNLKTEAPVESNAIYIKVNDTTLTATLVENSSTAELKELLAINGPLTIDMHDYSNFEKVGEIGATLPTNDEDITTEAGDLILYLGHRFVIYYDTNSWNFTRLGKINDVTQSELMEILGDGNVTVVLSLTK